MLQRRVGSVLFLITFLTAAINLFNLQFNFENSLRDDFFNISVLPTFIGSLLLLITALWDSKVLRYIQIIIVFLAGFTTIMLTVPGNLTGVIFLLFGMALAYQYRFFAAGFLVKVILLFSVYLLATFGNVFFINRSRLPFGIPTVLFFLATVYLYWMVFSEEIKRYLIRTNQLKSKLDRTASENVRLEHITEDQAREIKEKNRVLEKSLAEKIHIEEELRRTLSVKTILLQEIHHRVKNNLAVIIGLFNLQHSDDPTIQGFITINSDRLHAMAAVHETVYQNENAESLNLAVFASDILENLIKIYTGNDPIAVQTDMEDIEVPVDIAVALGIILNDCVSNSIVYGLAGKKTGKTISVTIRRDTGIEMIISDNGIRIQPGKHEAGHSFSFSLKLITLLAEEQLGGSFTREYNNGNRWIIHVPPLEDMP